MDRISTSKARKDFRNLMRRASSEGKRVKITHYGKTLLEDCETLDARRKVKKPPRRR